MRDAGICDAAGRPAPSFARLRARTDRPSIRPSLANDSTALAPAERKQA
jgi:hypothetical protein